MAVTLKDVSKMTELRGLSRELVLNKNREYAPVYVRLLDNGVCTADSGAVCASRVEKLSNEAYFLMSLHRSSYTPTTGEPLAQKYNNVNGFADKIITLVKPFCSKEIESDGTKVVKEDSSCYAVSLSILLDMLGSEKDVEAALADGSTFRAHALESLGLYYEISGNERSFTNDPNPVTAKN